jgi:hypothetical protein
MLVAEDLLFREWKCFEHLAPKREENRIFLLNLDGRPAVEASSGKKSAHFSLLTGTLVLQTHSLEMVEAKKNLDLVANV